MSFTPRRVESRFADAKGITIEPTKTINGGIRVVAVRWEDGTETVAQTQDLVFRGAAV